MSISNIKMKLPNNFLLMLEEVYTQKERDSIYKSFENGRNTSFRINILKGNQANIRKEFRDNKLRPIDILNVPNGFFLKGHFEKVLKSLECYKNGEIYLQSISSMLPALFIEYNEGISILDMCAAPGGKSLYAYSLANGNCNITANEPNEIRRQVLYHNVVKQGASINITSFDGRSISKYIKKKYDYIFVDAPCSGEGIIKLYKNSPCYNWNEKCIKKYFKLQKKLIKNAIELLNPGGIIIYSTCTLNPFENEFVIQEIIETEKVELIKPHELTLPYKEGITAYGGKSLNPKLSFTIRIVPSEMMEGFYIALLKKK